MAQKKMEVSSCLPLHSQGSVQPLDNRQRKRKYTSLMKKDSLNADSLYMCSPVDLEDSTINYQDIASSPLIYKDTHIAKKLSLNRVSSPTSLNSWYERRLPLSELLSSTTSCFSEMDDILNTPEADYNPSLDYDNNNGLLNDEYNLDYECDSSWDISAPFTDVIGDLYSPPSPSNNTSDINAFVDGDNDDTKGILPVVSDVLESDNSVENAVLSSDQTTEQYVIIEVVNDDVAPEYVPLNWLQTDVTTTELQLAPPSPAVVTETTPAPLQSIPDEVMTNKFDDLVKYILDDPSIDTLSGLSQSQDHTTSFDHQEQQTNSIVKVEVQDEDEVPCKKRRQTPNESNSKQAPSLSVNNSEKYRELRDKNNEASRRSRFTRKQRESLVESELTQLEKENAILKSKERLLTEMRDQMKERVMKAFAAKSK